MSRRATDRLLPRLIRTALTLATRSSGRWGATCLVAIAACIVCAARAAAQGGGNQEPGPENEIDHDYVPAAIEADLLDAIWGIDDSSPVPQVKKILPGTPEYVFVQTEVIPLVAKSDQGLADIIELLLEKGWVYEQLKPVGHADSEGFSRARRIGARFSNPGPSGTTTPRGKAAIAGTLAHEAKHVKNAAAAGTPDDSKTADTKPGPGFTSAPNPDGLLAHADVFETQFMVLCEISKCWAMENPPVNVDCQVLHDILSKKLEKMLAGVDALDGPTPGTKIGDITPPQAKKAAQEAKCDELRDAHLQRVDMLDENCMCDKEPPVTPDPAWNS